MATIEEEIKLIEEEIRNTKYNKATSGHIGKLKGKIARLKDDAVSRAMASAGGGEGFSVKKSGDGTVVLVGFPSVGKSTLLNKLTNTESVSAAYAFTTLTVVPGSMEHKGANIQILDIPGLIAGAAMGKGRGKEVIGVVRGADLILLLGDVYNEKHINVLIRELYDAGIRLNKEKPDITIVKRGYGGLRFNTVGNTGLDIDDIRPVLADNKIVNADILIRGEVTQDDFIDAMFGNRVYVPAFFAVNKVDLVDKETLAQIDEDVTKRFGRPPILLSAVSGFNIETLKDEIFDQLGFIRIFMKPVGGKADLEEPLIIREPATVEAVCMKLHRDFVEKFRYAKVWGPSVKHDAQRVGLSHSLMDGDILTVVTRA
jgi:small GTP-binding protein